MRIDLKIIGLPVNDEAGLRYRSVKEDPPQDLYARR